MNSKNFIFFGIFLIVSLIPASNAQVGIEENATQKSVTVNIDSAGNVHIKHVVGSSDLPKQIELISGTVSNLIVKDANGDKKQFSIFGTEDNVLLIHPSKEDSIVEYDLDGVLSERDHIWTWDFRYLESTVFFLPEDVELVFTNEQPIYLDEKKAFKCHGCQMILQYSINEQKLIEKIKSENKELLIEIWSHANVEDFNFDHITKSITLDIDRENIPVTIIIPSELLDEPYDVFLNDEKIIFHEFLNNETHVWFNMKPTSQGEIRIGGEAEIPVNGEVGISEIPVNGIIIASAIGVAIIVAFILKRKFNLH